MPVSPDGHGLTARTACAPGRPRRAARRCWRRGCGGGCRRSGAITWRDGLALGRARPRRPGGAARPWSPWRPSRAASRSRSARGATTRRERRPSRTPPPPPRAAAAAASAAVRSPASVRSAVWAKPVVSPLDDPDAGAAVAARRELLDLAVVEQRRRRALVLDEHLGELAAGAERRRQGPLDHGFFEHAASSRVVAPVLGVIVVLYRRACSTRPGREPRAEGVRRRHRARPGLGRGAGAGHARG